MNFPSWAPQELCEYYNEIPKNCTRDEEEMKLLAEEKALLERLLDNATMKPVWQALRKSNTPMTRLFWIIRLCYMKSFDKPQTQADNIVKLERIIRSAKELSKALKAIPLDPSPFILFNEADMEIISSKMTKMEINTLSTTILSMLDEIANESKKILEYQLKIKDEIKPFVSNWGAKRASVNFFIRVMHLRLKGLIGYRLLGQLASVVYDDHTIDENTVRSTVSEFHKSGKGKYTPLCRIQVEDIYVNSLEEALRLLEDNDHNH